VSPGATLGDCRRRSRRPLGATLMGGGAAPRSHFSARCESRERTAALTACRAASSFGGTSRRSACMLVASGARIVYHSCYPHSLPRLASDPMRRSSSSHHRLSPLSLCAISARQGTADRRRCGTPPATASRRLLHGVDSEAPVCVPLAARTLRIPPRRSEGDGSPFGIKHACNFGQQDLHSE